MSWNYRIMKRLNHTTKETWYGIHEVYYNDDGSVRNWTNDHMEPCGETIAELKTDLYRMRQALKDPILDYETGEEV